MNSKVVIVVDRNHWSCLACQLVNDYAVSIDRHVKSCHFELLSPAVSSSPRQSPDFNQEDFAEQELDHSFEPDEKIVKEYSDKTQDHLEFGPRKQTSGRKRKNETQNTNTLRGSKATNSTRSVQTPVAEDSRGGKKKVIKIPPNTEVSRLRKKPRLQSDSKCNVDKTDTENGVLLDSQNSGQNRSKKCRQTYKKTENRQRKRKPGTGQSRDHCLGGRPVKRSFKMTDQEMASLKKRFVGGYLAVHSQDNRFNPSLEPIDNETSKKRSSDITLSNINKESVCENNFEVTVVIDGDLALTTSEIQSLAPLSSAQISKIQRISEEGRGSVVPSENTQVCMAGTLNLPVETNVLHSRTNVVNKTPTFSQTCIEIANALDHDASQSHVEKNWPGGIESLCQILSGATETVCEARSKQTDGMSSTATSVLRVNTVPADNVNLQYDSVEITENRETNKHSGKTTESEEWVKNKTIFDFTKIQQTKNFEQPLKIHECGVCNGRFSTSEHLSNHMLQMSVYEPSKCQTCERLFHTIHDLNFHVFEDHERQSVSFCFSCGEKFLNMAAFEEHLYNHKHDCDPNLLDVEYHSCTICQTDVLCRYESLRKHYSKHKQTVCLECLVRSELVLLPNVMAVRKHKTIHSSFCQFCFQDFSSVEAFESHSPCQSIRTIKEDGQGVLCKRCNQWCPSKAFAMLHHKEHQLEVMRKWREEKCPGFRCPHCDKMLSNKRNLERHIAQQHSESRTYSFHCEFCGKGADSKNVLKDHIAIHHLKLKRYPCEYCEQRFVCAATLKRHILKEHATDKQYTCEECGQKFCEKFRLTKHMSIHTGAARFMCEQCGKGFHTRSDFRKHLAAHEDIQEFACQDCGQQYKRKEHLKRHSKKCSKSVHNNGPKNKVSTQENTTYL